MSRRALNQNSLLQLPVKFFRDRKRPPVQDGAQHRKISGFEPLFRDSRRLSPGRMRSHHQDHSVRRLPEQDGVVVGTQRGRIYEDMVKLTA